MNFSGKFCHFYCVLAAVILRVALWVHKISFPFFLFVSLSLAPLVSHSVCLSFFLFHFLSFTLYSVQISRTPPLCLPTRLL